MCLRHVCSHCRTLFQRANSATKLEPLGDISDTVLRLCRLSSKYIVLSTFVCDILRTPRNISRVKILPRVIFLDVCLPKLRDFVLRVISILRSGFLKIFLDPLPTHIVRFLRDRTIIRKGIWSRARSYWHTFNLGGPITSLSKISTKACWVLVSAMQVGSKPEFRRRNAYLFLDCLLHYPTLLSSLLVQHKRSLPCDRVFAKKRYFKGIGQDR